MHALSKMGLELALPASQKAVVDALRDALECHAGIWFSPCSPMQYVYSVLNTVIYSCH